MRPLLAVLALLGALLPGRAADAGLGRTLTITGSRDSYAILKVTEETTYWLDHTVTATYAGGRWGGFTIGTDWPMLWSVYDPRGRTFSGMPTHAAGLSGSAGVLYPGTYRVYLFTDGQPVTIRVPWTGPDLTIEPDARLDAHIAADRVPFAAGGTHLALPQDGEAGTITNSILRWELAEPTVAARVRSCYARPPASWATCDRRLGSLVDTDPGGVGGGGAWGGVPQPLVTKGRSFFAEVTGTATGVLTAVTLRYRPHPADSKPAPYSYCCGG